MMMFIYIKQHLSNIWSSIHEKVKGKTETKLKKSVAYKKSAYLFVSQLESKSCDMKQK